MNNYSKELAQIEQDLQSQAFVDFYDGKVNHDFTIGILTPDDQALLGSSSNAVLLSRVSLDDHKIKHPEIGLSDYQLIPKILSEGQIWQIPDKQERVIFMMVGGVTYRAGIKRTMDCEKNYLLTLFINTKSKPPKGAIRIR